MVIASRPLGTSGLEVSRLCLGSWLTFETMPRPEATAVLAAAADAGITFFDDARYNDHTGHAPIPTGYSEVLFGELFREAGLDRRRHELVLANKLWFEFWPKESIEAELEGSLDRLGLEQIDLLYCAEPPDDLPLPDLLSTLAGLAAAGRIRAWGVLNWPPVLLEEAHRAATAEGLPGPVAAQLPHNLIDRGFVEGPSARRALSATGVGVVASHCLAGGLLTGKYSPPGAAGRLSAEGARRARLERLREQGVLERIDGWGALAARHGATTAQLALAFSLSRPTIVSACFGARSLAQLEEDLGTLDALAHLGPAIAELVAETGEPADPSDV